MLLSIEPAGYAALVPIALAMPSRCIARHQLVFDGRIMNTNILALVLASIYLAGCSAINPVPGPERVIDPIYRKQFKEGVNEGSTETQYIADDGNFRALAAAASAKTADQTAILAYLKAGFSLSDLNCSAFFDRLSNDQSALQFLKNQTTLMGGLTAGLMGIFRAGTAPTAATAAAFAALGSSIDNINTSFLLAPNVDGVRDLVLEARSQIYNSRASTTLNYTNFSDAQSVLNGYEDLCSVGGIKKLINESVKSAVAQVQANGRVSIVSNSSLSQQLEMLKLQTTLRDRDAKILEIERQLSLQVKPSEEQLHAPSKPSVRPAQKAPK